MNLKLKSIADKGDPQKERLVIRVVQDTDVGEFIVMRTGFVNDEVNIGVEGTYWFPNKSVKAGDLVVLYSKSGVNKDKPLERGGDVHFFYWGQATAVWRNPNTAAVLAHAPVWESANAEEL
ncbi:hypothetical protein [Duganella sp. Root336D2]|uniref:hypothetical protein n=1 Tax=Duganella sp. Root336D2 TaxID=1736518 RepID=UPI0006FF3F5C|nr:hypothetical protein [Duganella sp. Root336D2]KQV51335.1 hypothetical protein ASD07_10600 [Duganella sp. Root336D2]